MKWSRFISRGLAVCLSLFVITLQPGCETTGSSPQQAVVAHPSAPSSSGGGTETNTEYRPGDKILFDFDNGLPQQWQQVVREDGTITLPLNKTIIAAGKRKGQLEEEIQKLYVPNVLTRLTVNIRAEERSYFVQGEVRLPGQKAHTGSITAMKAIATAGDFTDFANKSQVEIIRANREKIHMNAKKALKDPARYDVPVYPGDTVYVHRRFF